MMTFTKKEVNVRFANGAMETIEGYEFTHKGLIFNVYRTHKYWEVCEVSTGMSLINGNFSCTTRKGAVEQLERKVKHIGIKAVKAKVKERKAELAKMDAKKKPKQVQVKSKPKAKAKPVQPEAPEATAAPKPKIRLKSATFQMRIKGYETITVLGHEFTYGGIRFNVHRMTTSQDKGWAVSEVTTGLRVVSSRHTRKHVLELLEQAFNKYGEERMKEIVERGLEQVMKQVEKLKAERERKEKYVPEREVRQARKQA